MIDIDRFVARRKELGMSQVKLCQGICTQSTLSKFESQRQIPSPKIVDKLCERLGMTPEQLQSGEGSLAAEKKVLDALVFAVTRENFPEAVKLVKTHQLWHWSSSLVSGRFNGLAAVICAVTSQPLSETVTFAGHVLEFDDLQRQSLASQLAYLSLTIALERQHELRGAALFTEKLTASLDSDIDQQLNGLSEADYGILLIITLGLAIIYQRNGNYHQSNQWLIQLNSLAGQRNSTGCLPRAKLLTARNGLKLGSPRWQVRELLADAQALARLHHNESVAAQAAALLQQIEN